MTIRPLPLSTAFLKRYWEWARTSIWLIPTGLCVAALFLAVFMLSLDRGCTVCSAYLPGLDLDVAAARQLMGVLATSLLSVGGVSFSVTMVALTLTSGQYGPKVLRYFLGDTRSKLSLGLFFAAAVYALVVSIALATGDKPRLSIFLALALAMLAIIEFIGFIHRTASDLQADQLIQRLGRELRGDMARLCTLSDASDRRSGTAPWRQAVRGLQRSSMVTTREGYVQTADYGEIAAALRAADARGLLRLRPGDFSVKGTELIRIWHAGQLDGEKLRGALNSAIVMGPIRTPIQDPEFPITQIQQIAARALSTGINDPGTAITCIDWLTLALAEVVDGPLPGCLLLDEEDEPRLLVRGPTFASLLDLIFSPLRQFTSSDLQVASCLLDSLNRLACLTDRPDRLALILKQGERVCEQVARENHPSYDELPVRLRLKQLRRSVSADGKS